ncbi:hypothetical protein NECID01_1470 [Nematocida sp. AWRm77]|nr:hypothetical protein NECID01_1470 [Nematocida sp. AWRm77]
MHAFLVRAALLARMVLHTLGKTDLSLSSGVLFSQGLPGYLYNVGTQMYLGQVLSEEDQNMWIKGVSEKKDAVPLRIQKMFSNGYPYTLIALDDLGSTMVSVPKERNSVLPHASFNGPQVWGVSGLSFVHFYPNSKRSHVRFAFSPPVLKTSNGFKIYAGDKCLTLEPHGFLRALECVETLSPRGKNQIFSWITTHPTTYAEQYGTISQVWAPSSTASPGSNPSTSSSAPSARYSSAYSSLLSPPSSRASSMPPVSPAFSTPPVPPMPLPRSSAFSDMPNKENSLSEEGYKVSLEEATKHAKHPYIYPIDE